MMRIMNLFVCILPLVMVMNVMTMSPPHKLMQPFPPFPTGTMMYCTMNDCYY